MVILQELERNLLSNQEAEIKDALTTEKETSLPSFGPHQDTSKNYNFKDKVEWLPFKFNIGDSLFSREKQDHLLN